MTRRSLVRTAAALAVLAVSIGAPMLRHAAAAPRVSAPKTAVERSMDIIAERYVKLALAVGEHDPLYVDAYYGPSDWQAEAKEEPKPLAAIEAEAAPLEAELRSLDLSREEEIVLLRRDYLAKQLESLVARVRMLAGEKLSFDEESEALYGLTAPRLDESYFQGRLARVDSLLPPGEGTREERFARLKEELTIPRDKLDAVFTAAITEARKRTRAHIALPDDESFTVEYVSNQPWGAYNWYKGSDRSVIQINTDLPTYVDAPVGLACHEGYPGHHVQNVLVEQHLAGERGWVEFTIAPLFCSQSPLNEGAANFGIEVAFPGDERLAFERDVICPIAGLDPAKDEAYYRIGKVLRELGYAEDQAARRYLDGEITAEEAARFISTYQLTTMERARKLVTFIDRYRSYVINYNVGYDLVKRYIESRGGTEDRPELRWRELDSLLSAPHVPSNLR
jgi:hypothetical protein